MSNRRLDRLLSSQIVPIPSSVLVLYDWQSGTAKETGRLGETENAAEHPNGLRMSAPTNPTRPIQIKSNEKPSHHSRLWQKQIRPIFLSLSLLFFILRMNKKINSTGHSRCAGGGYQLRACECVCLCLELRIITMTCALFYLASQQPTGTFFIFYRSNVRDVKLVNTKYRRTDKEDRLTFVDSIGVDYPSFSFSAVA